jgi:hypothetical protein
LNFGLAENDKEQVAKEVNARRNEEDNSPLDRVSLKKI